MRLARPVACEDYEIPKPNGFRLAKVQAYAGH